MLGDEADGRACAVPTTPQRHVSARRIYIGGKVLEADRDGMAESQDGEVQGEAVDMLPVGPGPRDEEDGEEVGEGAQRGE